MSRIRKVALASVFVVVATLSLCAGRPVSAVRVVPQRTLQPVTADECLSYSMTRQSDGAGGFVRVVTTTFEILDENGIVREQVTVGKQLTNGESNALNGSINTFRDLANTAANL